MPPLNVLITVDTEIWPRSPRWTEADLADYIRRDFHGVTPEGEFGLSYQMDVLDAHGLKGVFLVESLFASAVGIEPLREVVGLIQGRGHEVQLHAHSEWLAWMPEPILSGRTGQNLRDFTEEEQFRLLDRALDNLRRAGATDVCAFRAGNYGADFATLRALNHIGIRFDTSYNYCFLDAECGLRLPSPMTHPQVIDGVCEVPVSFFSDYPGHNRPVQFCACSYRELRAALMQAWRYDRPTFVIVFHSNEFLRRYRAGVPLAPDRIIVRRFENLCRYLAENQNMFRTVGFSELDPSPSPPPDSARGLQSSVLWTMLRYGEQLVSRLR